MKGPEGVEAGISSVVGGLSCRTSARLLLAPMLLALVAVPLSAQVQVAAADDLRRLSIEELAQIKVTSVSKMEEPLNQAAAAVYVITGEAIRRSGVKTIPEILRLAPNLQVARVDANTYGISARGFNQSSGTANKLLVLIDGRVVYSPLFSGTFWDAQQTFVDDIDHIEVISGPGGALWGANAVNGVINIITKDAIRTRGLDVNLGAGTLGRRAGIRDGERLGDSGSVRVFGVAVRNGSLERASGASAGDEWNDVQGGFRADWHQAADGFTLQGDAYRGSGIGTPAFLQSGSISGSNISGSWDRRLSGGSNLHVQAFADTARRIVVSGIDARVDQYALETQYDFTPTATQTLTMGGGYRLTHDRLVPGPGTVFLSPPNRTLHFASVFAQDSIALTPRVKLRAGAKLEDNSYTGLEFMPDVRLAWSASNRAMLWTSVSRAVRTPSRFDTDLINTGVVAGGPDFGSEYLVAYEAGYRGLITSAASVSVSLFYNSYDRLRTVEASGPAVFPLVVRNNMRGTTQGIEVWGDFAVREWWRVSAGFTTLQKNLRLTAGSRDIFGVGFAGNDPREQWQLRSGFDLPATVKFDIWLRDVGRLPTPAVPAYLEADARIAWSASRTVELSIDGRNLLHARHVEFINPSLAPSSVPRSFTLTARWTR